MLQLKPGSGAGAAPEEAFVLLRDALVTSGSAARRPRIITPLPGPHTADLIARDQAALSTSFTRPYPLAIDHGEGLWVTDVDGNEFLDFTRHRRQFQRPLSPGGGRRHRSPSAPLSPYVRYGLL